MERPWVKPEDIKDYSDSAKVKARSDKQLEFDIARAEKHVIHLTNNKFDAEKYATRLPSDVKMAVILLAEAYAKQSIAQKEGLMSSETFDDYSYTLDTETSLDSSLGIGPLLEDYVLEPSKGKVTMKLRKL